MNNFFLFSSKLIKRSDNASVLAGHATLYCDKIFTDSLGIKLIMRDYSEIQSGKSICDRLSGSGKLRMKAYINSGNDVMNASDIKKGIRIIFNSIIYFELMSIDRYRILWWSEEFEDRCW